MNYLCIDVGTTRCKCQLFSNNGEILTYLLRDYDFKLIDGYEYVDIDAIETNIREMIAEISNSHDVASVCVSSFGEAFVLLDEKDNILQYPMLYTDPRGEKEAELIKEAIGTERTFDITGTIPHSMYSVSKLLYIKNNYPESYKRANKALLICDYIGYLLTGERVIDYSLASRTGIFDVGTMQFSEEMLSKLGIDGELFSTPRRAGCIVGRIKPEWNIDATLVLGSHDQICTSLGAGILKVGEAVDGMGTVECITTLFDMKPCDLKMGVQGYPVVPYALEGVYCTYVLNYSCGSATGWLKKKIMHDYRGEEADFYEYMENSITDEPSGIIVLPYFNGAATPYQDIGAKGAIINLTASSTDAELYKAILEGTAMEMRLNAEITRAYGIEIKSLVATGGGANSKKWLKTKADIQRVPIKALRSSEGGLCGCAMLSAVAMGDAPDLFTARDIFVKYTESIKPSFEDVYEAQYSKYKKIYKTVKEFF